MGNSSSSNDGGSVGAGSSRRGSKFGRKGRHASINVGLSIDDFVFPKDFHSNIGNGAFGKVLAMQRKDDPSRRFAVKCLDKRKVVGRDQVTNCQNELEILMRMDHHAYLVNLFYAFQDRSSLYMCTDLMLGGTLQRAIRKASGESLAGSLDRVLRFAAELTLALQFLHSQNVVHRDVKPENILLDVNDHLHLTDFNVSLYIQPGDEETQKHEDGWGSRGYRAPEVYLRTGRGFIFACDWWSAGAVMFEMLTSKVPYTKKSENEPSSELLMRMNKECADFSKIKDELARDFCKKLLRFDPERRIGCQHGCNSEVMIMTHPYFMNMDWDELERFNNPNEIESPVARSTTTIDSVDVNSVPSSSRSGINSSSNSTHSTLMDKPRPKGTIADIRNYAGNFDAQLDEKEKMRILQRNMGVLGFDRLDDSDDSSDEDNFRALTDDEDLLFKDWQFNVDFKLEQQARPRFTLLQTVSSLAPEQIKNWIISSSEQSLRALCSEMKAYREQAMKENYDHVLAVMELERLRTENLRITRELAEMRTHAQIQAEDQMKALAKEEKKQRKAERRESRRQSLELLKKSTVNGSETFLEPGKDAEKASDEEEVTLFSADTHEPILDHDAFMDTPRPAENTPPQSPGAILELECTLPANITQQGKDDVVQVSPKIVPCKVKSFRQFSSKDEPLSIKKVTYGKSA